MCVCDLLTVVLWWFFRESVCWGGGSIISFGVVLWGGGISSNFGVVELCVGKFLINCSFGVAGGPKP